IAGSTNFCLIRGRLWSRWLPKPVLRSETSAEGPRCSNPLPPGMDHWTKMVEEPRVDYLARYDVQPVIEPGKETEKPFTERLTIPIDKLALESLKGGNRHLFLYGEIAFSDLLGADYIQTFCFAYYYRAKQFVRWEGRYNKRVRATSAKGDVTA